MIETDVDRRGFSRLKITKPNSLLYPFLDINMTTNNSIDSTNSKNEELSSEFIKAQTAAFAKNDRAKSILSKNRTQTKYFINYAAACNAYLIRPATAHKTCIYMFLKKYHCDNE